ncbi:MAG: hypothetical protein JXD22_04930 [Sedimentisphaerales bacterium]|nr:hypothetical protein [Sedimentisphaerales bacterium]
MEAEVIEKLNSSVLNNEELYIGIMLNPDLTESFVAHWLQPSQKVRGYCLEELRKRQLIAAG